MTDERPSLLERMAHLNDLQMAYEGSESLDERIERGAAYIEALEYEAGLVGVLPEKPDARDE